MSQPKIHISKKSSDGFEITIPAGTTAEDLKKVFLSYPITIIGNGNLQPQECQEQE